MRGRGARHEDQRVLSIPPLDIRAIPERATHQIEAVVAAPLEPGHPLRRPRFIHMIGPALARHRRTEQDHIRGVTERADERVGIRRRQMLGDFDGDAEIEPPFQHDGPREIGGTEVDRRALERGAIDPGSIESRELARSQFLRDREPGALSASDVDHALRSQRAEDDRQHRARRTPRSLGEVGVECGVVRRHLGAGGGMRAGTRARTGASILPM